MKRYLEKARGFFPCDMGGGGGGGGGGTTSSTNTSYNVSVQPELMPYATDIAKKAQDLTASNYTPYQGQRLADFNPAQQQVQSETMNMGTPDQFYQGSEATRMAGLGSLMAGQNYNDMATNPYAMQAFMSPYMQNVVDTQKQQALLDYQRGTAMNEKANAARQGAFGGNRQAIMQGMNQDSLLRQLGSIQATGSQNAFQNAQQSMQYGSDLGLRGLGQAGQMAGQLAQIGGAEQQADLARLQAQGAVGGQQQALEQQGLTQNYQDFLKQQEYPYSQLAFYNSMIRGLAPVMPTTTQTYAANPSPLNQVASLGLGAYGISNLFGGNKKDGGAIKAFAEGGGVSGGGGVADLGRQLQEAKYAPQQTLQASLNNQGPFDPLVAQMAMQWQGEFKTAAQGQEAQRTAQQPSVLDRMRQQQQVNPEMQGLGATGADVGGFADGGIIGYAEGGDVEDDRPGWWRGAVPAAAVAGKYGWDALNRMGSGFFTARELAEAGLKKIKPSGVGAGSLGKLGAAGALGTTAATAGLTPTEDYEKRFGFAPGEGLLRDVGVRSLGAASDLGSALTLGFADRFYRDKYDPDTGKAAPVEKAVAPARPGRNVEESVYNPQGTQAASKKAASTSAAKRAPAAAALAESVLKPKEEGGISSLKTPSLEDDIAAVGKYADAASNLTKKERDALEAAEGARRTRAEEGKERRLDTAKGLAALQAAQALTQVGKPGITAFGEALGAAGKTGAEYQANEEKIQSELEKADIAHKQGILALRKGDVDAGIKMAEKRDAMLMKAEELKIMEQYRKGMISVEEAKIKLAELELPSKIKLHEAMASHHLASGAAAGAGKGAYTAAQAFDDIRAEVKNALNDIRLPKADRDRLTALQNDPNAMMAAVQQRVAMMNGRGAPMMPANPNVFAQLPGNAQTVPSPYGR